MEVIIYGWEKQAMNDKRGKVVVDKRQKQISRDQIFVGEESGIKITYYQVTK